jgi:molybdenum cofactor cytidylyltransferase
MKIGAIVLAAGRSMRMGEVNKLLVEVRGKSMLQHAVDAALSHSLSPVVVTGHEAETVQNDLSGRDVKFVHNADYAQGMSTSLICGIRALPRGLDAVLIMLADMPGVGAAHVEKLLEAAKNGGSIWVPTYGGRRGNPILWSARYFPEMLKIQGDKGARELLHRYTDEVIEVPMPDDAVHADIDTPQALEQIL